MKERFQEEAKASSQRAAAMVFRHATLSVQCRRHLLIKLCVLWQYSAYSVFAVLLCVLSVLCVENCTRSTLVACLSKNSATRTTTSVLNGMNYLFGGNKVSRLEKENAQLHREVEDLNDQIERLHADIQKLKDNHARELNRTNEQHQ